MLAVGGKTNDPEEESWLEVYDTETSDWTKVVHSMKFRHSSWLSENTLWIYGGFDHKNSNIPAEALCKVFLPAAFNRFPNLATAWLRPPKTRHTSDPQKPRNSPPVQNSQ